MNVASLELCKELFELSGWKGTHYNWYTHVSAKVEPELQHRKMVRLADSNNWIEIPAYDLGYLLRKLPHRIKFKDFELHKVYEDDWWAGYTYQEEFVIKAFADTPEDATCKLAIELFKQGVLKEKDKALESMLSKSKGDE